MHLLSHPSSEAKVLSSNYTEGKRVDGIHPAPHKKWAILFVFVCLVLPDIQWEEKSGNSIYRTGKDFGNHLVVSCSYISKWWPGALFCHSKALLYILSSYLFLLYENKKQEKTAS